MSDEKRYRGEIKDRATSSEKLQIRLKQNQKYGSGDFNNWFLERLNIAEGMHLLDVGCGTGAQTLPASKLVGPHGSICALDISEESVNALKRNAETSNVSAHAGDMGNLEEIVAKEFGRKSFDIVYSVYALYYSDDPCHVMAVMVDKLAPNGSVAIFTPDLPHSMVALASKHCAVPAQVMDSLRFGRDVVEPFLRSRLEEVETHSFHNVVALPDGNSFMELWRATTYYDASKESEMAEDVAAEIAEHGSFRLKKNGFLVIGSKPK